MALDVGTVRSWAESVLRGLEAPEGAELQVAEGTAPGTGGGVHVTLAYPDGSSVTVDLDDALPDRLALTLLAEQLQDSVIESTGGRPVPPCPVPGHPHPAAPRAVDGVLSWRCPMGDDPGARP
ncbi:hypothetical protein FRZ03_16845 [Streptomyces misionensis]|uniref:Uncharacterized protein n=1 Tax=Streptomyces misionensis TaxID=67331 RepID=A0A5C6JTP7_9ACTN|nr:hypothetical protein [Streptomyces misionensis]TWV44839.1 hypothetical protein FRZ03_16845 [Streptomyces misionensis]